MFAMSFLGVGTFATIPTFSRQADSSLQATGEGGGR